MPSTTTTTTKKIFKQTFYYRFVAIRRNEGGCDGGVREREREN